MPFALRTCPRTPSDANPPGSRHRRGHHLGREADDVQCAAGPSPTTHHHRRHPRLLQYVRPPIYAQGRRALVCACFVAAALSQPNGWIKMSTGMQQQPRQIGPVRPCHFLNVPFPISSANGRSACIILSVSNLIPSRHRSVSRIPTIAPQRRQPPRHATVPQHLLTFHRRQYIVGRNSRKDGPTTCRKHYVTIPPAGHHSRLAVITRRTS